MIADPDRWPVFGAGGCETNRAPAFRRLISREPMHALIIEPQALTAFMIEDVLRDIGYSSIAFAISEEEAVAAAEARRPDLVTAAVQLSGGCGIAAVEAIRRRGEPIVVFVTQNVKEVRQRIRGATIVRKPFGAADLLAAVAATAAAAGCAIMVAQAGEAVA